MFPKWSFLVVPKFFWHRFNGIGKFDSHAFSLNIVQVSEVGANAKHNRLTFFQACKRLAFHSEVALL